MKWCKVRNLSVESDQSTMLSFSNMKSKSIDKFYTLSLLRCIGDTYTMGHAGFILLESAEAPDILRRHRCGVGEFEIDLAGIADSFADQKQRKDMLLWFLPSLNKLLVTESFEAVKDFCAKSNTSKELKAEPWYEFARIIRNNLSHTFRFEFKKHDKKMLPVSWRGLAIDLNMDGKSLDLNFFGHKEGVQLVLDMEDFITNRV